MGKPLAAARITIGQRSRIAKRWKSTRTIRTDKKGRFTYRVPTGPTRTIRFTYTGTDTIKPANANQSVRTPARTTIRVSRRNARLGQAIRFSGWIEIRTSGLHTFHLNADGASRIAVDERWLLGADSWQTEKLAGKSTFRLEPGWHPITVDYVHRGPKEPRLEVEWEEPGGTREAQLTAGQSYTRKAGVSHNVINANAFEFCFIEVELK